MSINSIGSSAGNGQSGGALITPSVAGGFSASGASVSTGAGTGNPVGAATTSTTTSAATSVTAASANGTDSTTPSLAQVKKAVEHINASLKTDNQSVEFTIDQSSKRVVVKVIDPATNQVIRQVPTEEVLEMSKMLGKKLGSIINQQA